MSCIATMALTEPRREDSHDWSNREYPDRQETTLFARKILAMTNESRRARIGEQPSEAPHQSLRGSCLTSPRH